MVSRAILLGLPAAAVYVLLTACREVTFGWWLRGASGAPLPRHFFLLLGFSVTALVANVLGRLLGSGPSPYGRANRWDCLWLNMTTALSWVSYFEGLFQLGAVTFSSIGIGFLPLAVLVLSPALGTGRVRGRQLLGAVVVLAGVVLMVLLKLREPPATAGAPWQLVWGLVLTVATAFLAAGNNVLSERLNRRGVGFYAVFASRFWLLVLAALVWTGLQAGTVPVSPADWGKAAVFGLLGLAVPLLGLQLAIEQTGARVATFFVALLPVVVLLLQALHQAALGAPLNIGPLQLLGAVLVSVGVLLGTWRPLPREPKGRHLTA
jgi:drug/metabolite transporter (DMT)-like permease